MVVGAAGYNEAVDDRFTMAMVPERSRILHNFSSLPSFNLKWGRQKQLRCVKDPTTNTSSDDFSSYSSSLLHRHSSSDDPGRRRSAAAAFDDDCGIEAMREKLMLDLRAEVHQMKAAILNDGRTGDGDGDGVESKPWNLRTRRAVCKEPNNTDGKPNFSPARFSDGRELDGWGCREKLAPRAKFSVSLSKREIEEDFMAILGNRPARRPKKRSKYVQKEIDALFPGFFLTEISADIYKVNEHPESGKR